MRRLLGSGAAAAVLLVHDRELDRPAALKLLQGSSAIASPERFRDEARALSQLTHPNIVEIYDYGISARCAYLVLEYVEGGSLSQAIAGGPLPPREAAKIAGSILDALEYSHGFGILHRDLKPENVLVSADGTPKLADFGLAKYTGSSAKTATGVLVGTVEFMAPEVFRDVPPSSATDIYSWGCLLYFLAEGKLPFTGTLQEVVQASSSQTLPEAARSGPFSAIWPRVLAADPKLRPNAEELRRLLARCVEDIDRPAAMRTRVVDQSKVLAKAVAEPTRATHTSPPSKGRIPIVPALLAALLAAAGWGLMASGSGSGSRQARTDAELVEAWTSRLLGYVPKDVIQKLHQAVYTQPPEEVPSNDPKTHLFPGGERHQYAMGWTRLDSEEALWASTKPELKLSELTAATEGLPLREAFRADAPALRGAIAAASVPAAQRAALYRGLLPLQMVDAYYEAWGQPAPYGVRSVQQAFAPAVLIKTLDIPDEEFKFDSLGTTKRPETTPVEQGAEPILEPGEFLLHHWAADPQRAHPLILHDPKRLSLGQHQTMSGIQTMTLSFSPTAAVQFGPKKIRVHLGSEPSRRFRRLRLEVAAGNILLPDALRVEWNDFRAFLRPAPGESDRTGYDFSTVPEYTIELDVPKAAWRAGENLLTIRLVSLPGLNPRQLANLFSVHLVAES